MKHSDLSDGDSTARRRLLQTFSREMTNIMNRRGFGAQHFCDNYVLITDVPLTAGARDRLSKIASSSGLIRNFAAIDGIEVCQFLDNLPHVRRAYPQLLALADLDLIVNRDIFERSEAYLRVWQPRLATFVRTRAYDKAVETLHQHSFIVLDGPPEAGKSTVAAAIALAYAASGWEVVDVREPGDFYRMYQDKSQLFIADDAVGSISVTPALADSWTKDLPGILRKLDRNHQLIWTVRKYVLEEALASTRLGESIENFPGTHEVLITVGYMTLQEKAAIVYNHAKQANLSESTKQMIRQHAPTIVQHRNFTPEKIRQLFEVVLSSPNG